LFTYALWDSSPGQFDAAVEMLMQVRAKARMVEERLNEKSLGGKTEMRDPILLLMVLRRMGKKNGLMSC
jgi:hypothetical protein